MIRAPIGKEAILTPTIRFEQSGDEAVVRWLTTAAFEPMAYSDGSEAPIIDDLRRDGDLTLSLVATLENEMVGHIAFSPVTIDAQPGDWFGLGPVSVRPDMQGQGIGKALIREGLSLLKSRGASGCVLIGDPNYYRRFGFVSDGKLTYRDLPTSVVQSLSFAEAEAAGRLAYSKAFERR